jgi:hypothetical protein
VRHVRMLGLCLVAALALGAYAVSSASALEWGKCEKLGSKTGLYSGPNCTKAEKASPKGSGEYEWRKAVEVAEKRVAEGKTANVPFTGASSGGGGVLTANQRECLNEEEASSYRLTRQACAEKPGDEEWMTGEGLKIECANETATGETEGKNKIANVHVKFTGCLLFGSISCTGEGKATGEIETNPLKGKLGWISKSAKEVGVLLEPATKHGHFADFVCSGTIVIAVGVGNKKEGAEYTSSGCAGTVEEGCSATPEEEKHGGYDGIISPITPVNQMTSSFTQVYTEEPTFPLANIPRSFEGKHIDVLEANQTYPTFEEYFGGSHKIDWSSAGEEITNVNTPEEEGEIKA